jgi:hypothetical protein
MGARDMPVGTQTVVLSQRYDVAMGVIRVPWTASVIAGAGGHDRDDAYDCYQYYKGDDQ